MAALYAATHHDDEDDDLQLSGPGPRDSATRNQLLQNGWRPYAVKIGSKWVSYKETPLFFVMGTIGAMKDRELYEKASPDDDTMLNGASLLLMRTLGMVVETTATKNLSDALDALTSTGGYGGEQTGADKFGRYLERTAAYSATGYVPGSGLLRQFSRDAQDFMDADKKEAKRGWEVLQQDLPIFRDGLRPALDALGEPMKVQADRLISGKPFHRDAQTQALWDVLSEKGVGIPVPNQRTTTIMAFQVAGEGKPPTSASNPADWKEGPMSDELFYEFLKIRGALMKKVLLANMDALKRLDHDELHKQLATLSKQANTAAKYQLVAAKQSTDLRFTFRELAPGAFPTK